MPLAGLILMVSYTARAAGQQRHTRQGGQERNCSVSIPGTHESKFSNPTKLAKILFVFVPLISSFQEGDTRSSFDSVRIGGEVTFCRLVDTRT